MKEELMHFALAHELNEKFKPLLLKNNVHFRPSLNSLSLISISEKKPELGTKSSAYQYKTNANIEQLIAKDLEVITKKDTPRRPTPEKVLQAFIIREALKNDKKILPFGDNITFISSEIALKNKAGKKIVTDILGYNNSRNELCIIELKYDRQEKRLIEQVNNFETVIKENPNFFTRLLSIHGFSKTSEIKPTVVKIVVWPHKSTSPKANLKEEGIIEVTYQLDYSFQEF